MAHSHKRRKALDLRWAALWRLSKIDAHPERFFETASSAAVMPHTTFQDIDARTNSK